MSFDPYLIQLEQNLVKMKNLQLGIPTVCAYFPFSSTLQATTLSFSRPQGIHFYIKVGNSQPNILDFLKMKIKGVNLVLGDRIIEVCKCAVDSKQGLKHWFTLMCQFMIPVGTTQIVVHVTCIVSILNQHLSCFVYQYRVKQFVSGLLHNTK